MRKVLVLASFLFAAVVGRATITPISQTSTYLEFNFSLTDDFLSASAATDSLTLSLFPGNTLSFLFRDRFFLFGDQEQFSTSPSSGSYDFVQNSGALDLSGSYVTAGATVNWTIDSTVTTILGGDTWKGKFVGHAARVPDSGSTLALFGSSLVGLAALRRKLR